MSILSGGNDLLDLLNEFANEEGATLHLVDADGIDKVFLTYHLAKLAEVKFRNNHLLESTDDLTEVLWKRVDISKMDGSDGVAVLLESLGSRTE